MNAIMRGDGCRKRHDAMKMKLLNLLTWAGIPVNCEVFNLFADAIPQAGLSRIEQGRRRQGLVPDFKLRGEEGDESILCELKFISASKTRYPRNPQRRDGKRAVDVRAEGLTAEYAKKAQNIDHDFGGVPRPSPVQRGAPQPPRVIGRVEARLQSFGKVHGWCFGSWGEASEDVHPLVQLIAKSMLLIGEMRPGRRGPPKSDVAQLAALVSYVRTVHHCCAGTGKDVAGETAASWGRFCRCWKATREGSGGGGEGTQGEAGTVGLLAPGPGHHSPWLWQAQLGSNYTISSCEMLHFILVSSCSNKCFTTEKTSFMYLQTFVFLFFFGERKNYKHYSTTCFQIFLPICCTTLSFSPLQRDYTVNQLCLRMAGATCIMKRTTQ